MMKDWIIVESVREMDRLKKHLENKNHLGGGYDWKMIRWRGDQNPNGHTA